MSPQIIKHNDPINDIVNGLKDNLLNNEVYALIEGECGEELDPDSDSSIWALFPSLLYFYTERGNEYNDNFYEDLVRINFEFDESNEDSQIYAIYAFGTEDPDHLSYKRDSKDKFPGEYINYLRVGADKGDEDVEDKVRQFKFIRLICAITAEFNCSVIVDKKDGINFTATPKSIME
jgi:hypothetical protein